MYKLKLRFSYVLFPFALMQKKKYQKEKIKPAFSPLLSSCVSLKKKNSLRSNSFFFLTLHSGRSLYAAKMRLVCHADGYCYCCLPYLRFFFLFRGGTGWLPDAPPGTGVKRLKAAATFWVVPSLCCSCCRVGCSTSAEGCGK